MTIYNLGSINVDHLYLMERLPEPGETLSSRDYIVNMGGKGLNITVAAQRSGADIKHIGAIGAGDKQVSAMLADLELDPGLVAEVDAPTGHAIVYVDDSSENSIVIHGGANQAISEDHVRQALIDAGPADWLVLQNETNANDIGLKVAREKGMNVALVAAPFDPATLPKHITEVDLVTMNASETALFEAAIGKSVSDIDGTDFLLTFGSEGALFRSNRQETRVSAFPVEAVDTTGAGDTFFGVFMAGYASSMGTESALRRASAAAALMVQRKGAATVVPTALDVDQFLKSQP